MNAFGQLQTHPLTGKKRKEEPEEKKEDVSRGVGKEHAWSVDECHQRDSQKRTCDKNRLDAGQENEEGEPQEWGEDDA